MKRMKLLSIFGVLCVFTFLPLVSAQGNWIWSTDNNDSGTGLYLHGDFLYTVGATTVNETNDDGVVLKWDLFGNLEWSRKWVGDKRDIFNSIYGRNGFIYSCGSTDSYGSGNSDLLLVKWDENGNQVWNRTWGGSTMEIGYEIWAINDSIYTSGVIGGDIFLVKWDVDGSRIWNKTWGSPEFDNLYGGLCGDDDAIYLAASKGQGRNADIMLQKWSHNGDLLWFETWGTEASDYSYDAWCDQNRVFIVGATGESELKQDIVIVAWDKNGTKLWDTKWNLVDYDIGLGIWGDNSSLYVSGHSVDWATTTYGGEVSVVIRLNYEGEIEADYKIENSQYVSDIVGGEDSLFVLGHKGGGTTDTDILVTELEKNFESNSRDIPGFPLVALAVVSVSVVLIFGKKLQRSTKSK